jgi:predicted NUDIX family phosphoesterase
VENDPSYKQVIPYVVLSQIIDDDFYIYTYYRTKNGAEPRLHNLCSIGIGGHINPIDGKSNESYGMAMHRELMEEVNITGDWHSKVIGCLYDDSNEVGKVHFGIVHLAVLKSRNIVTIKEDKLARGSFMPSRYLINNDVEAHPILNLENWSKLTADYINTQDWRELTKSRFEVRECQ